MSILLQIDLSQSDHLALGNKEVSGGYIIMKTRLKPNSIK